MFLRRSDEDNLAVYPRGVQPRREFDWVSVCLVLSILFVLFGVPYSKFHSWPEERGFVTAYWVASLASLVGSATVALRRSYLRGERALRRRQGLCPRCGCDLHGTPGRCPKCVKSAAGFAASGDGGDT